jgi:hypothetical protein
MQIIDMPTIEARVESTRLLGQAMALQLANDGGTLAEVELLLNQALELWESNLEALEECAHFYDAVMDEDLKAIHYATLCRAKASALLAAMDEILADRVGSVEGSAE